MVYALAMDTHKLVSIVGEHAPLFTAELCRRAGVPEGDAHPVLLGLIRARVLTFTTDGYRLGQNAVLRCTVCGYEALGPDRWCPDDEAHRLSVSSAAHVEALAA